MLRATLHARARTTLACSYSGVRSRARYFVSSSASAPATPQPALASPELASAPTPALAVFRFRARTALTTVRTAFPLRGVRSTVLVRCLLANRRPSVACTHSPMYPSSRFTPPPPRPTHTRALCVQRHTSHHTGTHVAPQALSPEGALKAIVGKCAVPHCCAPCCVVSAMCWWLGRF
jgi:hypothetical protein